VELGFPVTLKERFGPVYATEAVAKLACVSSSSV
jgi:hypothetical protein